MKLAWMTLLFSIVLAACGGGGGRSLLPSAARAPSASGAARFVAALKTPTPSPVPTWTPTPAPTASPALLTVQTDNSTSSEGVFIGEVCPPGSTIDCLNFASTMRHGIALGNVYVDWGGNLTTYFQNSGMAQWPAAGITPMLTWQPPSSATYAAIASGSYDTALVAGAQQMKAFGSLIFVRPFHEFNGTWYSWGLANQGADAQADTDFIAAWQHVVNVFRAQGATNVKFVWCFSVGALAQHSTEAWDQPAAAYPGDNYVDWIAFDTYNRGSLTDGLRWKSFDTIVSPGYAVATAVSPHKPIAIAEMASNEYGDGGTMKSQWVNQMLYELHSSTNPYPRIHLVTWFGLDLRGYSYDPQSTQPTYTTFVNALRVRLPDGTLAFRSNGAALANVTGP